MHTTQYCSTDIVYTTDILALYCTVLLAYYRPILYCTSDICRLLFSLVCMHFNSWFVYKRVPEQDKDMGWRVHSSSLYNSSYCVTRKRWLSPSSWLSHARTHTPADNTSKGELFRVIAWDIDGWGWVTGSATGGLSDHYRQETLYSKNQVLRVCPPGRYPLSHTHTVTLTSANHAILFLCLTHTNAHTQHPGASCLPTRMVSSFSLPTHTLVCPLCFPLSHTNNIQVLRVCPLGRYPLSLTRTHTNKYSSTNTKYAHTQTKVSMHTHGPGPVPVFM